MLKDSLHSFASDEPTGACFSISDLFYHSPAGVRKIADVTRTLSTGFIMLWPELESSQKLPVHYRPVRMTSGRNEQPTSALPAGINLQSV